MAEDVTKHLDRARKYLEKNKLREAIAEYETALDVSPEHVPTMQAMARLIMERDRSDERLPRLIESIAMRGETDAWRDWARSHAVSRGD